MDWLDWLLWIAGVVLFLVILMVSVGLHEAGHMVAAKKLGVKVPEFFVGFGTKLFGFKRGGTEYGMRLIPAGGYVRLVDESVEEGKPEREALSYVAPWKRQIIYVAGPLVNIVLGFVILFGVILVYPYDQPSTTIEKINSCSAEEAVCGAETAGIVPGDKLLSIDGTEIKSYAEISPLLKGQSSVAMEVLRDGKILEFANVPVKDDRFGVNLSRESIYRTPGEAAGVTVDLVVKSGEAVLSIPQQIPGLVATVFTGAERDPESVGSVVGAGKTYGDVAATEKLDVGDKIRTFLLIAGGLNMSLGLLNLLPILPLDGGRMLFAFIDSCRKFFSKIRKKKYTPTPYKWIKIATVVPALMLIGVMALLIVADIVAPITIV